MPPLVERDPWRGSPGWNRAIGLMRHREMWPSTVLALTLVLSACAADGQGGYPPSSVPTSAAGRPLQWPGPIEQPEENGFPPALDRPPPVVVRNGDTGLPLEAWTACYGNGCYDGVPPQDPPVIGNPTEILVEFSESGWEFTASVTPVGEECGRRQPEPLERIDATTHRLTPIGLADEYQVTLFDRGPSGDLFVTFVWNTPPDGVMPVPKATASILADRDGSVASYGVQILLWNLAATPANAAGEASVTSVDGAGHTFSLAREEVGCDVGTVSLTAPVEEGLAADDLGDRPFIHTIVVESDGETYVGTGVWPDQEDPECAPCVPLQFTPPLPALGAGDDL